MFLFNFMMKYIRNGNFVKNKEELFPSSCLIQFLKYLNFKEVKIFVIYIAIFTRCKLI